jgi:sugar phosphate isomerase/epimerase
MRDQVLDATLACVAKFGVAKTTLDDVAREAGRFAGVHVSDVRSPTRSWADRVLPGDGVADVPAVLAALDAARDEPDDVVREHVHWALRRHGAL